MTWGVPDWADPTGYPANLTLREWWWQFTRRRPAYRDLWTKWGRIKEAKVAANRESYERHARAQGTPIDVFLNAAPTDDPDGLRRKFGTSIVLDPRKDYSEWTLLHYRRSAHGGIVSHHLSGTLMHGAFLASLGDVAVDQEVRRLDAVEEADEEAGIVAYAFDISEPLNPQIDRARAYLLERQAELFGDLNTRRPHRDRWPMYLRALDARDAHATYIRIGATFWRDEAAGERQVEFRARDVCTAAAQLRDNFPI